MSFTSLMTVVGLAVASLGGSIMVAQAVVAGDVTGTFVRFCGSIVLGLFYLYLFHLSRGRRFHS